MTRKKVFGNFGPENGHFFTKKRHSEILVCEFFSRLPQTRRQVSAYAPRFTPLPQLSVISRAHSFPRAAEFQAEPRNLDFTAGLSRGIYRGIRLSAELPRNFTFFTGTTIFSQKMT